MRRPLPEQQAIRDDVFRWLDARRNAGAYEYSRSDLENYTYNGERIPLLDASRGIRNPVSFDSTLTVMTSSKKTVYSDGISPEGLVRYSYQSREGGDNVKLRNAQKFLAEGNRVKATVRFRGREMAHTDIGRKLLMKFAEDCAEVAVMDKEPKLDGRHMNMFLSPKVSKDVKK